MAYFPLWCRNVLLLLDNKWVLLFQTATFSTLLHILIHANETKQSLPHPERCPLCNQDDEIVQHILTSCVFAWQFWFFVLQPPNLAHLMLNRSISSFAEWWRRSWKKVSKQDRKDFNSLCILGAWTLWKHRNACVFDGAAPNLQQALHSYKDESQLWKFSGAKGLAALDPGRAIAQA